MTDVTFSHSADQWSRLQLALYEQFPRLFTSGTEESPVYDNIILARTDDSPLLVSDGTGDNVRALSDSQLSTLITTGKPADDTVVKQWTNDQWKRALRKAKRSRDTYQSTQASDPFDDDFAEI